MIEIMKWNEEGSVEIEAKPCGCVCTCTCSCSEPLLTAIGAAGTSAFPAYTTSAALRKSNQPANP